MNGPDATLAQLPDPERLARRAARLSALAEARHGELGRSSRRLAEVREFLALAPEAEALLDELSRALFGEVLDEIEHTLTEAVREILGMERKVVTERESKAGRLWVTFQIENAGGLEDILVGQGGSVLNILSVSLRLIALSRLSPEEHRPFLVLDEQDCWLRPDLVPRFMGVIRTVARRLGIQVLVISHHPLDLFATKAERIYGLCPSRESGVTLEMLAGNGEAALSTPTALSSLREPVAEAAPSAPATSPAPAPASGTKKGKPAQARLPLE